MSKPAAKDPLKMTLSLNVLNHLGINLYSNVPAVLSELVANAWDADAEHVKMVINAQHHTVTIEDDGDGMTKAEVNGKYLNVGYQRRADVKGRLTNNHKRPVMGRKGIGKLSLFSIARDVHVYTVRNGERVGFRMLLSDIEKQITDGEGTYFPTELDAVPQDLVKGTRIVLSDLKKNLWNTAPALRKRLARRFSIFGPKHKFKVVLDDKEITIEDRDYFGSIQYLWAYGTPDVDYEALCKKKAKGDTFPRSSDVGSGYKVSGWIGTVKESGTLKAADDDDESLNRLAIIVRGKLAHEDFLEQFTEGGVYTKYLIGELRADFLDTDTDPDIATTSRQRIVEDDPRFTQLKTFVLKELRHIETKWSELRARDGSTKALEIPAVKKWYEQLGPDHKKKAQQLFGKIYKLAMKEEGTRRELLKHGILAFEVLRYKKNLDALEALDAEALEAFGTAFAELNDLEATYYYQIVKERVTVIDTLKKIVDEDQKEKVIQKYLFDHLWLLDTGWDRPTGTPHMEETVKKAFAEIDAKLSDDEKKGRLDIRYKTNASKHVIVELKRASVQTTQGKLQDQVLKYMGALKKVLAASGEGKDQEPIEAVCVVGRLPVGWEDPELRDKGRKSLQQLGIRLVTYDELINNAQQDYKLFLEKNEDAGRILQIIQEIDAATPPEEE
jgi:hypothetical protein